MRPSKPAAEIINFDRTEYTAPDDNDQQMILFIPLESIPMFFGREDRLDEAKQWLR